MTKRTYETKRKTGNFFHLVMTILTFGLWLPIWLLCAVENNGANWLTRRKIKRAEATEAEDRAREIAALEEANHLKRIELGLEEPK